MADFVVGMTSGLLSGALIATVSWTIFRKQAFNARQQAKMERIEEKISLYKGLSGDVQFCLDYIGEVLAETLEAKADREQDPTHDISTLGFNSFEELSNFSLSALRYPTQRDKSEAAINELRMRVKKFRATLKDLLSSTTEFSDIDVLISDLRQVQSALTEVQSTVAIDLSTLTDEKSWVEAQQFNFWGRSTV